MTKGGLVMLQLVEKLYKNEEGQGLVEYALILALIAVVVIVAVTAIGKKASNTFEEINKKLGNI